MSIRNLHPADELALIRGEITLLEAREAELRSGFLSGQLPVTGAAARVEIRQQQRRIFCKERLPPAILNDPQLWEQRVVLAVVVQKQPKLRTGAG